jgi:hypothetical protein
MESLLMFWAVGWTHPGFHTIEGAIVELGPRNHSGSWKRTNGIGDDDSDIFLSVFQSKLHLIIFKAEMNAVHEFWIVHGNLTPFEVGRNERTIRCMID